MLLRKHFFVFSLLRSDPTCRANARAHTPVPPCPYFDYYTSIYFVLYVFASSERFETQSLNKHDTRGVGEGRAIRRLPYRPPGVFCLK